MKILLTGGRNFYGLEIARQLHFNGHKVFSAETSRYNLCAFSSSVTRSFVVPPPRNQPKEFCSALVKICQTEKIDLLLPMSEEVLFIAEACKAFPCPVFCSNFDLLHTIHHKGAFQDLLKKIGLSPLSSHVIESQEDLDSLDISVDHILKPCYSRGSKGLYKIEHGRPFPKIPCSKQNPYLAQRWVHGDKYCIYSVAHKGKMTAFSCYPVEMAIAGSSCLTFRPIVHKEIESWTKTFIEKTGYTGQISFDFVQEKDGSLFAIECNPRATSGLHLFTEEGEVLEAIFNPNSPIVYPKKKRCSQIFIGMLLYGWLSPFALSHPLKFLKAITSYGDVVFNKRDLKPFLCQPILFGSYVLNALRLRLPLTEAFTYDLDWEGN